MSTREGLEAAVEPREAARLRIGELRVDPLRLGEAVDAIATLVAARRGGVVFTPNVDHVVRAERDLLFRAAYRFADLSLADGMPLVWASRLLGRPLPERVAGADLVTPLCARAAELGWRVYLLGGAAGDAERAAEVLQATVGVRIAGTSAPRIDPGLAGMLAGRRAAELVRSAQPDLVLVAMGAPKQELWIYRHAADLRPAVAVGVGASLAFLAGTAKRAPRWMSRAGLEWLHRLCREPRRLWRRYLVDDLAFLPIVARTWRSRRRAARLVAGG